MPDTKLQTHLSVFCFGKLGWDSANSISPWPLGCRLVLPIGGARARPESWGRGERICSFLSTCWFCLCGPSTGALAQRLSGSQAPTSCGSRSTSLPAAPRSQHQPGSVPWEGGVPALRSPVCLSPPETGAAAGAASSERWAWGLPSSSRCVSSTAPFRPGAQLFRSCSSKSSFIQI